MSYFEVLLAVAFVALAIALIFPLFQRRDTPQKPQCINNARQIIISIQIYQADNNGKFPSKETVWEDIQVAPKALICPTSGNKKEIDYGYNAYLSGKMLKDPDMPATDKLPVLADSKTPAHLLETSSDIDFRHNGKAVVGYGDGHVALLQPVEIQNVPVKEAR